MAHMWCAGIATAASDSEAEAWRIDVPTACSLQLADSLKLYAKQHVAYTFSWLAKAPTSGARCSITCAWVIARPDITDCSFAQEVLKLASREEESDVVSGARELAACSAAWVRGCRASANTPCMTACPPEGLVAVRKAGKQMFETQTIRHRQIQSNDAPQVTGTSSAEARLATHLHQCLLLLYGVWAKVHVADHVTQKI